VEFLFELFDFGLADIGVEGFLHFAFELVLSFPEENLSLAFDNFIHEFGFFFSDLVDVDFELDGLAFHFLELFDEFRLQVDVFILKFGLFVAVDSNGVIELVHFLLESFEVNFDFLDLFFEGTVVIVESGFLLFHDGLFVLQVLYCVLKLLKLVVFVDKHGLFFDPLPVKLVAVFFEFLCLSDEVDVFVFEGIFSFVVSFGHKFVMEFVESAHFVLFFFVDVMSLSDLDFVSDDQVFFLVLFGKGFIFFLLKQFDLRFGVELIDFDSGDFIEKVLEFHLLFFDLNRDSIGLFQEIGGSFLNGGVFAFLVDEILINLFSFLMQLHDVVFNQVHTILNRLLFGLGKLDILLGSA
jgi:hypothetical protein